MHRGGIDTARFIDSFELRTGDDLESSLTAPFVLLLFHAAHRSISPSLGGQSNRVLSFPSDKIYCLRLSEDKRCLNIARLNHWRNVFVGSMKNKSVEKRVFVSKSILFYFIFIYLFIFFFLRPEWFLVEWKITEIREVEEDGRRRGRDAIDPFDWLKRRARRSCSDR